MSPSPVRVLLVDDHKMMRDGLRAMLSSHPGILVVGEAGDAPSALESVRSVHPDVVVMDVGLPQTNGIDATAQILEEHPEVRVIALSTYSDWRYVESMLRVGARGYVIKAAAGEELVRAVEAVMDGHSYTSPEITTQLMAASLESRAAEPGSALALLAAREREVLHLLAEGRTSAGIGSALGISARTVEAHRRNIQRKLGLRTVAELTKYAVREGLSSLDP